MSIHNCTCDKVFGIKERVLSDGSIDTPLDIENVKSALKRVKEVGGDAIVVALMHAYRNPEHERFVAEIIRKEAPEIKVILASDIWPVVREYELITMVPPLSCCFLSKQFLITCLMQNLKM